MRISEQQSLTIGIDRAKRQGGRGIESRICLGAESAMRPLHTRQRGDAFTNSSRGAERQQLPVAVPIAEFVARSRTKIRVWLPAKSQGRAVEALVRPNEMETTLETEFQRKLLGNR